MLAIIWHSRTGASAALAEAAGRGLARRARLIAAEQVQAADLLAAEGYLFIGPENLGSLVRCHERAVRSLLLSAAGAIGGAALCHHHRGGFDGHGAQAQLDRIVTGWRLRRVAEPLIVNPGAQTSAEILAPKQVPADRLVAAAELGEALGTGLALGVF